MNVTKIREYAKALAALLTSVGSFLLTVNAPPQWQVWVGSAGALVTTLATFGVPNGSKAAPADAAITAIQQTVQQAAAAVSEVDRVKQAASDVFSQIPVLGPLAQQVINSLPKL